MTAIDLGNALTTAISTAPASRTTASTGATIDAKGVTWGAFIISQGAMHTSEVITYKVQESSDGSSWTDAVGLDGSTASFAGAANADDTVYVVRVECARLKRYIRLVCTPAGSNAQVYGVTWVGLPAYTGDAVAPNVEA